MFSLFILTIMLRGVTDCGVQRVYDEEMPKRDLNTLAAQIVEQATDEKQERPDPDAVESGRVGGKARAAKLTPERRSEIARKAAQARWAKYHAEA